MLMFFALGSTNSPGIMENPNQAAEIETTDPLLPLSSVFTPEVQSWAGRIKDWAAAAGLDSNLVATVMQIESCGDPGAVSRTGALGLFQVMPFHFSASDEPYAPDANAARGLDYLRRSLATAHNDARLAFAGYNGGIGVISRNECSSSRTRRTVRREGTSERTRSVTWQGNRPANAARLRCQTRGRGPRGRPAPLRLPPQVGRGSRSSASWRVRWGIGTFDYGVVMDRVKWEAEAIHPLRSPLALDARTDGSHEVFEIDEPVLGRVLHDTRVDLGISVHENVAKARHPAQGIA
jgi:hypothetical protein